MSAAVALLALATMILTAVMAPPETAAATSEPTSARAASNRAAIGRLYFAAFDRPADSAGLEYWTGVLEDGVGLTSIADYFVRSTEFQTTYGAIDEFGLVDLIYRNVLRRPPDTAGLDYWAGLLQAGHSPGTILNGFAQSPEFVTLTTPAFPQHILMVGDSIFHGIRLLGIPVGSAQLTFMTEEGRQASTLPTLLNEARADGPLATAEVVVIHLGTNGWRPEYEAMFDVELTRLAPTPVYLVNTEVARAWEATANSRLAELADRHDHVETVDWNAAVASNPQWMRPDGIHPNADGLMALATLIETAIREAG